jgi:hypothetical protein
MLDNELNDRINLFIYQTKTTDDKLTWSTVADIVNDALDIELTGNAVRKRFYRVSETVGSNVPVVAKNPVVTTSAPVETVPDSDLVTQLRQQFGVGDEYVPRKIKTTSTDDRTWQSVEWTREAVSENHLEHILEQIAAHAPKYTEFKALEKTGKHLLIPIMYDAHIGKRLIDGTQADYSEVAKRLVEKAIAMNYDIDRIMFVVGNDFGNTDNVQDNTTAGTPQDVNTHWANAIDIRCEQAVKAIETFASVAQTDVIMIHGNHDRYSNHWLGRVLDAWFKNNERVVVNNSADSRKYYGWNRNMWGLSHGNEENPQMYPALMAVESSGLFAQATNREMFVGHFHRKQSSYYPLTETNGVTVRWMPALSGPDAWHKLKGYVGAKQQALGIVYNESGYDAEFAIDCS